MIARYYDQHAASLEQDARQPLIAMEVDGHANTKTRERTEGAAIAVQAMRGDSFSACRVDPGPNTNLTSFGKNTQSKFDPYLETCDVSVYPRSGRLSSSSSAQLLL